MPAEVPHRPLPLDLSDVRYALGPDSSPRHGVPPGTVTELTWAGGRRARVHVPATYDESAPAALLVLQDGSGFLDPDDDLRVGVVLDNLVAAGDLPTTIAVCVDPVEGQRNAEYDAPDDRYATRLADELLPEVARRWSVVEGPAHRAIGGFSSGGSAAFTAAWHRPDVFGQVLCLLPSFAQVTGGNPYLPLIAEEPRRPLRVFVQEGHRDLGWDEPEDNWLATNLRMAAALLERGYDVRVVLGDGGHTSDHAGAVLPDALRWLLGPTVGG